MKHLKNFSIYTPESESKRDFATSYNIVFLKSEDGQDWYESQTGFDMNTVKIMYDRNNIIRAMTKDVSGLYPEGKSVIEFMDVPEEVTIDGFWKVEGEAIVKKELSQQEKIAEMQKIKKSLFENAEVTIAPLRDAVSLGIATEEEEKNYRSWQKYRVLLNRMNVEVPDDIVWPDIPKP